MTAIVTDFNEGIDANLAELDEARFIARLGDEVPPPDLIAELAQTRAKIEELRRKITAENEETRKKITMEILDLRGTWN
jgi:hypothetical protein